MSQFIKGRIVPKISPGRKSSNYIDSLEEVIYPGMVFNAGLGNV